MNNIERTFRLTPERRGGMSCGPDGLFLGDSPLLAKSTRSGRGEAWVPRPLAQLNRDLSGRYGLPVDLAPKMAGLAAAAKALSGGDLVRAQIAALHLQLPDPPDLAKLHQDDGEITALARRLHQSGLLKFAWDPAQHPRLPVGSPDSTGGQFTSSDGSGDNAAQAAAANNGGSDATDLASATPTRTLHFKTDLVDPDGSVSGSFFISPPSETGGVIVQKITSTDTDGEGRIIGRPLVGWEAWEVPAHSNTTAATKSDDEWLAPPRSSLPGLPSLPSVGKIVTVTGEARFYEGLSRDDLMNKYGFAEGGSGFSGRLISTKTDPNLPLDHATPPLKRSRTFVQW